EQRPPYSLEAKPARARQIAAATPALIGTFLLTSHASAPDIAEHVRGCGTSTVQIVQHLDLAEYPRLMELLPAAVRCVQVIRVEDNVVRGRSKPCVRTGWTCAQACEQPAGSTRKSWPRSWPGRPKRAERRATRGHRLAAR